MVDRDEDEEGQRGRRERRYSTGLRHQCNVCESLVPKSRDFERVLQRWTVVTRMKYDNLIQEITRYCRFKHLGGRWDALKVDCGYIIYKCYYELTF